MELTHTVEKGFSKQVSNKRVSIMKNLYKAATKKTYFRPRNLQVKKNYIKMCIGTLHEIRNVANYTSKNISSEVVKHVLSKIHCEMYRMYVENW